MQYVAPAIIVMAGLGASVLLARLPGRGGVSGCPGWSLSGLFAIGLGMMAWDVTHPYRPRGSSEPGLRPAILGRRVLGAEALRRTDLHLH